MVTSFSSTPRRIATVFFSIGLAAAAAAPKGQDLPNFQQVNERVYRGGQPTAEGFKVLSKLGVKTVIDLQGDSPIKDEEFLVKAAGMRYINIPMRGMETPTNEHIIQALALMNDANAGPVFVHCHRGADRTGAVIACYRITHDGWDNSKALKEARFYGMSWYQTALQHYVRGFAPTLATVVPVQ